jgi:hypothetical protein
MIVEVYIEGQRLDLYEDEGITVKQVTKDLKDISKIFADFSQSFNVPASARNNNIFKHYYNASIDGGYDARTRKPANIVVGGLDFKWGKMRLDGVEINNNTPSNYKITFFGNILKIKDVIGDDKLFDLSWLANFNHSYDSAQVKTGLTTGLDFLVDGISYPAAVTYPLISYSRQYFYNSDPSETTDTDTLVNIASNLSVADHGIRITDLKAAIKLNLIVKAIEQEYGFDFNSSFFSSTPFSKIYMNLNNSVESLVTGLLVVDEQSGSVSSNVLAFQWRYKFEVIPDAGFENVEYKRRIYYKDELRFEDPNFITGTKSNEHHIGSNEEGVDYDYDMRFEVVTVEPFEFTGKARLRFLDFGLGVGTTTLYDDTYAGLVILTITRILDVMPDIKVYDFLTSLFKTFNLIAYADGEDIFVEDLPSWYSDGKIIDVTQFIDYKKENVNRGNIFRQINYNFEESDQILAEQYRQTNNLGYGDLEFELTTGVEGEEIDGDVLEVQSIFENPIFERLFDLNTSEQTTIQYCLFTDREIKPIVGKPFIFFAQQVTHATDPISYINGSTQEDIIQTIMPTHSLFINTPSFNLNFNSEINEYTGDVDTDTIYQRYWSDYIGDMFSVKRRIYSFEAILPVTLLNTLKLNDRLIIKGDRYIINSISSNIVTRKDTLELINDIYDSPIGSDTLSGSYLRQSLQEFNHEAQGYSFNYVGISGSSIAKVDLGDDITWFTITSSKVTTSANFEVEFTIEQNGSGFERVGAIRVNDGLNNPQFIIIQNPTITTVDSTTITADSTLITSDNG